MSEQFIEDEYDNTDDSAELDESPRNKDRKWVRELENRAKNADKAKAEAAAAKRELAMLKAGIEPDSPQGKLFQKAFDGEPTVENVKAFMDEYGLSAAPKQEPVANTVPAEELAAHDRLSRAASASTGGPDYVSEINSAETPEQVMDVLRKAGVAISNEQPGRWKSLV